MILLDTHIWVWWTSALPNLTPAQCQFVHEREPEGLGVSIMSCWEVAKLASLKRLVLDRPVEKWVEDALCFPGVRLVAISPRIVVEANQLPQQFHRDPVDQLLVATARVLDCPLLTADEKVLQYAHVQATDGSRPPGPSPTRPLP